MALSAVCAIVIFVTYGLGMIAYPLQLDYGEGVMLQLTAELSEGHKLYRDPQQYPWLVDTYAPLYTAVCAVLRPILGLSFAAGRLVSWLAGVGALACVTVIAARRGRVSQRWFPAVACAAAIFICSPLTVQWAALYRVDFLGLFFELLALLAVDVGLFGTDTGEARLSPRALAVAAPLFALAFFTKQTYVQGLIAASITVFARDRRTGVAFGLWAAMWIAVPFLIAEYSGVPLVSSLFTNNIMPWSWARGWPWVSQYLVVSALPFAAAGWLCVGRQGELLWRMYFLVTAIYLVGVGRVGAYYNHFLPFHAALAIAAALAVARLTSTLSGWKAWAVAALAGAHVVGFGFAGSLRPTLYPLYEVAGQVLRIGHLRDLIARAHGDLAAEVQAFNTFPGDVVAENMGLPLLAGRRSVLCDPSTLFGMAEAGRWDPRPFLDAVRKHRFGVILLQRRGPDNARFPIEALRVIEENYVEAATFGGDHLLVPRRAPRSQ